MNIALVNGPIPYENAITHMPLDLIYIGTMLKDIGFTVQGFDLAIERDIENGVTKIKNFAPSVIITCFSRVLFDGVRCLKSSLDFLENLKISLPNTHICAVGEQATFRPERCLSYPYIDSIVRYTPEIPAVMLCDALKNNKSIDNIKGVITPKNITEKLNDLQWYYRLKSLDELGIPDRTIFPIKKYLQKDTETVVECSRGCNHRCLFCQRSRYHRYNVTKSLSNIVADLKNCVEHGFKSVFFTDLDFVRDIEQAKQISTAILQAKLPLKWACNMRADIIDEKHGIDLLKLMKKAGCYRVFVGLESSSNDILQDVNKGISQDYGIKLKQILDEIGIKMHASFLIGLPNDTPQKITETVKYAKLINADMTSINALIPMPGTPYGDQPEKYGLQINQNDLLWFEKEEFMYNQVCGNKTMSASELQKLHKKAYRDLLLA